MVKILHLVNRNSKYVRVLVLKRCGSFMRAFYRMNHIDTKRMILKGSIIIIILL